MEADKLIVQKLLFGGDHQERVHFLFPWVERRRRFQWAHMVAFLISALVAVRIIHGCFDLTDSVVGSRLKQERLKLQKNS